MGYFALAVALLAGNGKGYLGKRLSARVTGQRQSAMVNFVRMLLCIIISGGIMLLGADGVGLPDGPAVIYGLMAGVTLSVFTVTWMLAVQKGAYMLVSVAQMFGMVITLACSFAVFREPILPRQLIAVGILTAAVVIMGSYSAKLKGSLSVTAVVLLGLCGVSSGLYDFSLKLFTHYSSSGISTLNLFTYLVSAVALYITAKWPGGGEDAEKLPLKKLLLPIGAMSVFLFLNSYFKALATRYLPSAQVYPIYQAGAMILGTAMSAVCFKERVTLRCAVGLALAFIAIVLLK